MILDKLILFLSPLLSLIAEIGCYGCGKNGSFVCLNCQRYFSERLNSRQLIPKQFFNNPNFENLLICFYDHKLINKIIHQAKYYNQPYLLHYFAPDMINNIRRNVDLEKIDFLIYMPSSHSRELIRGNNHLKNLSKSLSKNLKIPILHGLKIQNIANLATLDSKKRKQIIKGRFFCNKSFQKAIVHKNILIIDDYITTGASMTELQGYLHKQGARSIIPVIISRKNFDQFLL